MAIPISICGEHVSRSEEETRGLGEHLASALRPGDVVRLDGPLGAGKTQFVKGLAVGLGCGDTPSSPTFSLVNEYPAANTTLAHFDFYRLEDERGLARLGLEDYLGMDSIAVIEWAEKFPDQLPETLWRVRIDPAGGDVRTIRIDAPQ